jgi:transmembrane sensor
VSASSHTANSEDAALWFARRRRGVMTLEERAAFESWRREPANAAAMAELEQVWATLQIAQGHIAPRAESVPVVRAPKIAAPALLAVMCAVSIGIGVISYSGNHEFWTSLDWVDR